MDIKRVSILGCGWFGHSLGKRLVGDGIIVNGSTTRHAKVQELAADHIRPFVLQVNPSLNGDDAEEFFNCDVLIVTIPPRTKENRAEFFHQQLSNVAMQIIKKQIKRVVFISSTSVYPSVRREVQEEDADMSSMMGIAESIFRNHNEFGTTVLRFGGLIGPGRHPGRFLSGKEVDGGDDPVNVVHLNDCVKVTTRVIQQQLWNETFNVCADEHPTRRMFYSVAAQQLGLPLPMFKGGDVGFKIVSNSKVKSQLNYDFEYSDPMKMIR